MDGYEVVRFAPRTRKPPFQELVKGLQVFQPPVLSSSDFAQIAAEFDEFRISIRVLLPLPGQNLVDPGQHEQSALLVQLRRHGRTPSNQTRQTNQGDLPSAERWRFRPDQV